MRLLQKPEADQKHKKQQDELIAKNSRLLGYFTKGIKRFNSIQDSYDQQKVNRLKDFENFCADLQVKKSKLLEEYVQWEKAIEEKKEQYYALIAKQDELDEREYSLNRKEEQLTLREEFTKESEDRLQANLGHLLT